MWNIDIDITNSLREKVYFFDIRCNECRTEYFARISAPQGICLRKQEEIFSNSSIRTIEDTSIYSWEPKDCNKIFHCYKCDKHFFTAEELILLQNALLLSGSKGAEMIIKEMRNEKD